MPDGQRCLTQSDQLSVRRWIAIDLAAIVSASDHLIIQHSDRAHWHIGMAQGAPRFIQCQIHPTLIVAQILFSALMHLAHKCLRIF